MHLVNLERYRHRDIEITLRELLGDYEIGELSGIAVAALDIRCGERFLLAGHYKQDTAHALSAALKMSRAINGM